MLTPKKIFGQNYCDHQAKWSVLEAFLKSGHKKTSSTLTLVNQKMAPHFVHNNDKCFSHKREIAHKKRRSQKNYH